MDGYYRGGRLAGKVKADEAVAAARQEGRRPTRCWCRGS
jgi:hypothetical protein